MVDLARVARRVIPLLMMAGCGMQEGYDVGSQNAASTYDNTRMQNTRMQNTRMQNNGTMQYGAPLALAGVDLTHVWKPVVPPAAGQVPDLGNLVAVPNVKLVGSTLTDGTRTGAAWAGYVIDATFANGADNVNHLSYGKVYIDSIIQSASDAEIFYYTLRAYHQFVPAPGDSCGTDGCPWVWEYACGTTPLRSLAGATTAAAGIGTIALPQTPVLATAVGGQWDYHHAVAGGGNKIIEQSSALYGTQITFACTNGAIGKCVNSMHYKPWKLGAMECAGSTTDGTYHCLQKTLELEHEACVRMVRADYCGDGEDHTIDGMALDVWDPLAINQQTPYAPTDGSGVPWGHEAEWTPSGARCINPVLMGRVAGLNRLDTVQAYLDLYCKDKWSSMATGTTWSDANSQCFGASSTFHFGNVPWRWFWTPSGVHNAPAIDLHQRVYIDNKSVCVEDTGYPNVDAHSPDWCLKCLPNASIGPVCSSPTIGSP